MMTREISVTVSSAMSTDEIDTKLNKYLSEGYTIDKEYETPKANSHINEIKLIFILIKGDDDE